MEFDAGSLTMTEIIRLQDLLSRELTRRFARPQALALSDIVDSTAYFAEHGDEAGRRLQQRHVDLIREALKEAPGGRLVDQVGDGAFLCFPTVDDACRTLIALFELLDRDNAARPEKHLLQVRTGVHWGTVLTDGVQVTGDAVNLAARIKEVAEPGEIRLTRDACSELPSATRLMCVAMPPVALKGISRPVETLRLEWRDRTSFPDLVRIEDTGQEVSLPPLETITFGRLKTSDGVQGNAVVLTLPDEQKAKQISRWHFELRRRPAGMVLRQLSNRSTEVDGQAVAVGSEVPIKTGSVVRLGQAMTLTFKSTAGIKALDEATYCP
jgi:class 3 adenylate cyclase